VENFGLFLPASKSLNKQNYTQKIACYIYVAYIKILEILYGGFLIGVSLTVCIVTVVMIYTSNTLCRIMGTMTFVIFRRGKKKDIPYLENYQRKVALRIIARRIEDLDTILKTMKMNCRDNTSRYIQCDLTRILLCKDMFTCIQWWFYGNRNLEMSNIH
jgi:hypothetical protein